MQNGLRTLLKWLFIYPVGVFLCLEIAFRIMGYQPFHNDDYSLQSTPPRAFIGHPQWGIQLNPGTYQISINQGLTFTARHLEDHSRYVTGRQKKATDVLLLGCSFTYGFGVDDNQNFASLLQHVYPEAGIENLGVVGYGSVQSLMQLQEHLTTDSLKVVLLHFSSFHFMRNILSPQYRSNLKIGYNRSSQQVDNLMHDAKFPYKPSCAEPIAFVSWAKMYTNWPGRGWFAAMNALQTAFDQASEDLDQQVDITACLLEEMRNLCLRQGVQFGVICLDTTPETQQLKQRLPGMNWLDVGFDFKDQTVTNRPFDSHPNPTGHRRIAQKIQPLLGRLLHEK